MKKLFTITRHKLLENLNLNTRYFVDVCKENNITCKHVYLERDLLDILSHFPVTTYKTEKLHERVKTLLQSKVAQMSSTLKKSFTCNFTQVPNHVINNGDISLKSKGLYMLLISKPDNWTFRQDNLINESKDGESSFVTAMKELEQARYIKRTRLRVDKKLSNYQYEIFDKPYTGFPSLDILDLKTSALTNTDINNTKSSKREEDLKNLSKMMFINILRSCKTTKDGTALKYPYGDKLLAICKNKEYLYDTYTGDYLDKKEAEYVYQRLYTERLKAMEYIEDNTDYRFSA